MRYAWDDKYLIDYEDIDLQHHYFFNLIVKIDDAAEVSDDREYLKDLFSELYAYIRFHFRSEENVMKHAGYSKLDEHVQHHDRLINEFHQLERALWLDYEKSKLGEMIDYLMQWFVNHTINEDRQIAQYLNAQKADN